ncbi:MAG: hypothetical protein WBK67_01145 [Minisyncoccales bacterium]
MSEARRLLAALVDMLERSNTAHLNYSIIDSKVVYADDLVKAANECLSNPLPNPVAWMQKHENGVVIFSLNPAEESDFTPLYAGQPASKLLTESSQDRTKKYFSHDNT